ncbi:MAG: polysaccharide pyruvyl transferase CsaB [Cyanobacteria bacterium P01_C01_bin.73]
MRAVLCGYYGMGNGGDEALLASLLQLLPSNIDPIVLSGNPEETRQRYRVEACPRKSLFSVLSALRRSQFFIWGGGSLMQDTTSALNPLYYGGLMGIAQLMGLKTVAWAQGIGPLQRGWAQRLTRSALQGCVGVSVRDRASAELLNTWNTAGLLAPDPVWTLDSQPVPGLWDLHAPRIAVALRSHPWLTPARLEAIATALKQFQTATQACVLLVPFQPSKDLAIAQRLHNELSGPSQIYRLEQPAQLKGLFRGVEMVIGMRFHALVMAAAEGCRCFGLSYDPKVVQLLSDLNLPGWDLDPAAIAPTSHYAPLPEHPGAITEAWLQHYANGDPLDPTQISALVDRAYLHRELLQDVMTKSVPRSSTPY